MYPALLLPVLATTLAGCVAGQGAGDSVTLETRYAGARCFSEMSGPSVRLVKSLKDYKRLTASVEPPSVDYQGTVEAPKHFDQKRLIVIRMGTKPTAGYALALAEKTASLNEGLLTVKLQWVEPQAGAFLAQVITSPCLILEVDKIPLTELLVVDQNGRTKIRSGNIPGNY